MSEGMPFRQPPKGGEDNAHNDYGVGFATRDGTVSLVAHYTPETSVGPHNVPIAPIVFKRAGWVYYRHPRYISPQKLDYESSTAVSSES